MNTIDRQELKERLLKEGYVEANGLERTIDNLLNLEGKAADMLYGWLKSNILPQFEAIEGVDSTFLREQIKMKEPAIILSYGMLLKDPQINGAHLRSLQKRRLGFRPRKDDENK